MVIFSGCYGKIFPRVGQIRRFSDANIELLNKKYRISNRLIPVIFFQELHVIETCILSRQITPLEYAVRGKEIELFLDLPSTIVNKQRI